MKTKAKEKTIEERTTVTFHRSQHEHEALFERGQLEAVTLFCGEDETRIGLTGVHVEVGQKTIAVAMDGVFMGVFESGVKQDPGPVGRVLLTRDFLRSITALHKSLYKDTSNVIALRWSGEKPSMVVVEFVAPNATVINARGYCTLEVQYTDWRAIVPDGNVAHTVPASVLTLSAERVAVLAKVAKLLGGASRIVQLFASDGAGTAVQVRVVAIPGFFAVIMQCDTDEDPQREFESVRKYFRGEP